MISIVLADDHQVVRQGLRALLEAEPGLTVIGEAADGLAALTLVEQLRPQVLLLDLMMRGLHGLEVVRRVAQEFPRTKVAVLSMHAERAYVQEALRHGATGYVLKGSGADELVSAVHAVAVGTRYLSARLAEDERLQLDTLQHALLTDPYESLTSREREVLQLTAEGNSSSEIAARLSISPRTAESHRANLMRKLGLRSQTELIRYALKRGILPLDE